MANTNFLKRITTITADWLNQINMHVYGATGVAAIRGLNSAIFSRIRTLGYTSPGDNGAGEYYFDPSDTTSADNGGTVIVASDGGRWKLVYTGKVSASQFGTFGDGTTDDSTALQNVMSAGISFYLPKGKYRTTKMLSYVVGTRLQGENWATSVLNNETADVSEIFYDGPDGAEAVISVAAAPVGTMPGSTVLYMTNIGMVGVAINGNGKAKKGVYGVGCWLMNQWERVTVTQTKEDAFWFALCWGGSPRDIYAVRNLGKGITLGRNDYTWSNATVEQAICINFYGKESGCDATGTPLNIFDEVTNQQSSYGIGVFGARGLSFSNAQTSLNDGVGIYLSTSLPSSPIFFGGYLENDCRSSHATAAWDIWVQGDASGNTAGIKFYSTYLGGTPAIRLTGTQPSRVERSIIFDGIVNIAQVKADWSRYRLKDCDSAVTISNIYPLFNKGQYLGSRSSDISGSFSFTGAAASILVDGVITGLTKNSTGNFTYSQANEIYSGGHQKTFFGPSPAGWEIDFVSKTNSSYTFTTKLSGTLTDPTFTVDGFVIGYYN